MPSFLDVFNQFFNRAQPGQIKDTSVDNSYEAYWSAQQNSYLNDNLRLTYKPITGLALTKDVCDLLDEAVSNDPIFSACYERIVSSTDTEFEVKLETSGKGTAVRALEKIRQDIPKLFPCCYTLKEVRRFIISRLTLYGAFHSQIQPTENLDTIEKVIIPSPYTIRYVREDNRWIPYQYISGNKNGINHELFVNCQLNTIQNNEGIWFVPPLKAALHALYIYNLFQNSLAEITRKSGIQKVIGAKIKASELTTTFPDKRKEVEINRLINNYSDSINGQMGNSVIVYPDFIELHDVASIEPSTTLVTIHELLSGHVITGAKLFPSLVGTYGKENQTTLSSNQKQAFKQLITSIQSTADSALKQILQHYITLNGYQIKNIEIDSEAPELEDELTNEQAKEKKLTNEKLEKELMQVEQSQAMDEQNNIDNSKKKEPEMELESDNTIEEESD